MRLAERWAYFRSSFRFRLFLLFSLLISVFTLLIAAYYLSTELDERRAELERSARMMAENLCDEVRLPLYAENAPALTAIARQALRLPGVHRVAIQSAGGNVLVDERRLPVQPGAMLVSVSVPVKSAALAVSPSDAMIGGSPTGGQGLGTISLEVDNHGLDRRMRIQAAKILGLALAFWALLSIGSYQVLWRMTRSYEQLMQGLEALREGNLSTRLEVAGEDEPARAAEAVNRMAEALERREKENKWLQDELVNAMQLEVQQEKRNIMAKLIQTNRMTSIGLLASSVAHEINTPNGAIKLANQYLVEAWRDVMAFMDGVEREGRRVVLGGQEYAAARERLDKTLDVIGRCSGRIEEVVTNLRSYYLGDLKDQKEPLYLNQVVEDALVIIRAHRSRGSCELKSDLAPRLPMIHGKRGQLEQVVINLVMNALHAIPESRGGLVQLSTEYDASAGLVRLVVRDDGDGIPREAMAHLLEPFFSTRVEQGGSGLGLYICNYIVGEHDGVLAFDSQPGRGTCVTVDLPAMNGAEGVPA